MQAAALRWEEPACPEFIKVRLPGTPVGQRLEEGHLHSQPSSHLGGKGLTTGRVCKDWDTMKTSREKKG